MLHSKNKLFALLFVPICAATLSIAPHSFAAETNPTEVVALETNPQVSISSEADLAEVVAQLKEPATRLSALSVLIHFSSPQLYNGSGSIIWTTGDQKIDNLQKQAAKAIRQYADYETVSQALDSTDSTLQFWGVWFWSGGTFKDREIKPNPWSALVPKIKNLAVNGSEGARAIAVERLPASLENNAFLEEQVNVETSPSVLLQLLGRSSIDLSKRFNSRLLVLLNNPDKDVRINALSFIGFNHNSAPMWQIEFDQLIADKVLDMAHSTLGEEKRIALYALDGMKKQPEQN